MQFAINSGESHDAPDFSTTIVRRHGGVAGVRVDRETESVERPESVNPHAPSRKEYRLILQSPSVADVLRE